MSSGYSPNTAIVAVSKPGAALARRLASCLPEAELHLERRFVDVEDPDARAYDLPLRPVLQNLFVNRDALIVFLPIGAAVRLLAPVFAGKKRTLPWYAWTMEAGSRSAYCPDTSAAGMTWRAQVAAAIGALPVVTSASDALNVTAIDLVGRAEGWRIDATPVDLTRTAAAVVNGEPVALWLDPETGAPWPDDQPMTDSITRVNGLTDALSDRYAATLLVSDRRLSLDADHPVITYRPAYPVGRRGVSSRRRCRAPAATVGKHARGARPDHPKRRQNRHGGHQGG